MRDSNIFIKLKDSTSLKFNFLKLEQIEWDSSQDSYFYKSEGEEIWHDDVKHLVIFPGVQGHTTEEVVTKNFIYQSIDKNFQNRELNTWHVLDIEKAINATYEDLKGILY